MPSIGSFLLHYHCLTQDERALAQLNLTLQRMAYGGIYDQLGGGFSRYATDNAWRIPHFEKMLYDNGQLLSLYAQAYTVPKKPLYKKIVLESIEFVEREMVNAEGGCYSALDADSEGAEGTFYTWEKADIAQVLGEEAQLLMAHFIEKYLLRGNQLWHSRSKGEPGAPSYLEDYAWVARSFISLYQITFEEY